MNSADQKGQAMPEYLLCTAVLLAVLVLPWFSEQPVLVQLVHVLSNWWHSMTWLVSLS